MANYKGLAIGAWGGIAEARASMPIMLHGLSHKVRLTGVTVRRHRPTHSLSPTNQLYITFSRKKLSSIQYQPSVI